MNVTPPRFRTMHICVGHELISRVHTNDTAQEGARWIHRQLHVVSVKLRSLGGRETGSPLIFISC